MVGYTTKKSDETGGTWYNFVLERSFTRLKSLNLDLSIGQPKHLPAVGQEHLRVTSLHISNMNLAGTIQPHIGNLTFLVYLNMSKKLFGGNLPEQIYHLRRLRIVDLTWNNFTGEVPRSWFSSLHRLRFCYDPG
ncbi:Non-specific serine/threonine protein kinase [Handroanthus impetiginosus]|uniref:Non-specific serine/threonine protein kinase n=1 Tax=Handroanthus impetiginosus TaxID=429701 RepID=A0A2G9HBV8_9LAMI|nr:Non-specific serine/threonine protein kinase [Handroanthus impetiginosus]